MQQGRVELLAASPFFRGLRQEEVAAVAAGAVERRVRARQRLFREGEPADALFLVLAGRVKLTQSGAEGHEVIVRYVGPGGLLAAVAVFSDSSYPATAQAVGESLVLAWPRASLLGLLERHPALAINAMKIVSERMREMQERFRELATERVARRVARALLRLAGQAGRRVEDGVLIDLALSRQDLAEMTGTTLFTVSRLLSDWEAAAIVSAGRRRVVIRSPHALMAIAEDLPSPDHPSGTRPPGETNEKGPAGGA